MIHWKVHGPGSGLSHVGSHDVPHARNSSLTPHDGPVVGVAAGTGQRIETCRKESIRENVYWSSPVLRGFFIVQVWVPV